MVIPKIEVEYLFDLDGRTYNDLFAFAKKVASSIEKSVDCIRLGMVVYGLDVPHVHIHLIPLKGIGNELNFSNPKVKLSPEEFQDVASKINYEFERLK